MIGDFRTGAVLPVRQFSDGGLSTGVPDTGFRD